MKLNTFFIFSSLFVLSSSILLKSNNCEYINLDDLKKIGMFATQLRQTYTLLYHHINLLCETKSCIHRQIDSASPAYPSR